MSASITLIKVSYTRIVSVKPYETVRIETGLEAQPAPGEKVIPEIRRLQEAVRLEVEAVAAQVVAERDGQ